MINNSIMAKKNNTNRLKLVPKPERYCNTKCNGAKFELDTKDKVWAKRTLHPTWGNNWGYDKYGHLIKYEEYGKASKKYGWDIDHSKPVAKEGSDNLNNLQPVQSYYNRHIKADNYPWNSNHENFNNKIPNTLNI